MRASQVVLVVKNPPANAGDIRELGSIPGSGRSPGGGHRNPLQCSCLENPMDRGAWRATAHQVAKSLSWLKDWQFHFPCPPRMAYSFPWNTPARTERKGNANKNKSTELQVYFQNWIAYLKPKAWEFLNRRNSGRRKMKKKCAVRSQEWESGFL